MRISYGHLRAALPIAHGPRNRARRTGTNLQHAAGVERRYRAAARADRMHVDHRHAHRQLSDRAFVCSDRCAV